MTLVQEPRAALAALADSVVPYLLGVRHHSPALAAAVPALLDASGAEVVCVELPTDFQPWLTHLGAPGTLAPVALAGAGEGDRLGFYPFADFSPELAAIRWARERGAEVVCCDLPMSDPRWSRISRYAERGTASRSRWRVRGMRPRSPRGGACRGPRPCRSGWIWPASAA